MTTALRKYKWYCIRCRCPGAGSRLPHATHSQLQWPHCSAQLGPAAKMAALLRNIFKTAQKWGKMWQTIPPHISITLFYNFTCLFSIYPWHSLVSFRAPFSLDKMCVNKLTLKIEDIYSSIYIHKYREQMM